MAEQVNKEQTKDAKQEKITGLSDEQLAEAQGGANPPTILLGTIEIPSEEDEKAGRDVIVGDIPDIRKA